MSLIKNILLGLLMISVTALQAEEIVLTTITNSIDEVSSELVLVVDEDSMITSLLKKTKTEDDEETITELDITEVNGEGVILEERRGHVVAKLMGLDFDLIEGGAIEVDILVNGATGERKKIPFYLQGGNWDLLKDAKIISNLHLVANSVPGLGVVGIKDIVPTYLISLTSVTNTLDERKLELFVEMKEGKIISLINKVLSVDGDTTSTQFDTDDLNDDGIILEERKGHVVAKLVGDEFDFENGGQIIADILVNGATGKRKEIKFELLKTEGTFDLLGNGKKVVNLHLIANVVPIFGAVGIKKVEMSFSKSIALVTNDIDGKKIELILKTNSKGTITELIKKDHFEDGKIVSEVLDLEELGDEGLILEERKGHIIAKIESDNFDVENGGDIAVDILVNGATGERKKYNFSLNNNTGDWALVMDSQIITAMHLIGNKVPVLGLVGIKDIEMH